MFYKGGNGIDFFQADPLAAQYLQPTSPSPGLPIAVCFILSDLTIN